MYLNRMTMAYKAHNAVKKHLKEQWDAVCNGYLLELANMWEWDCKSDGYWIGDEVGDVWCYGDNIFIGFDDMRYVVENDVSYETYSEWQEYCVWANEFNQDTPNLNAWCKGCPRLSESEQQKLRDLKKDFESAVKDYKERTDKKNNGLF